MTMRISGEKELRGLGIEWLKREVMRNEDDGEKESKYDDYNDNDDDDDDDNVSHNYELTRSYCRLYRDGL
jgi:hypothetical protein